MEWCYPEIRDVYYSKIPMPERDKLVAATALDKHPEYREKLSKNQCVADLQLSDYFSTDDLLLETHKESEFDDFDFT